MGVGTEQSVSVRARAVHTHQYIVAMETSPTERFMHYTVTFVNEAV